MIKRHEVFVVPDENKTRIMKWEVNWNPKDKKTNDCKILRVVFPDGKEMMVKREYLNSLLFIIGTPEMQQTLVPQKIVQKRRFQGQVKLKATKDISKGEEIITTCYHDLPELVEDTLSGHLIQAVGSRNLTPKPNNL